MQKLKFNSRYVVQRYQQQPVMLEQRAFVNDHFVLFDFFGLIVLSCLITTGSVSVKWLF